MTVNNSVNRLCKVFKNNDETWETSTIVGNPAVVTEGGLNPAEVT
ncbi:MAG: hypothetical protein QNJ57_06790 [Flavobacteriaceae bacterium]|nr:hypothetical protein [Flavobacteriaceae bacterium]